MHPLLALFLKITAVIAVAIVALVLAAVLLKIVILAAILAVAAMAGFFVYTLVRRRRSSVPVIR